MLPSAYTRWTAVVRIEIVRNESKTVSALQK